MDMNVANGSAKTKGPENPSPHPNLHFTADEMLDFTHLAIKGKTDCISERANAGPLVKAKSPSKSLSSTNLHFV